MQSKCITCHVTALTGDRSQAVLLYSVGYKSTHTLYTWTERFWWTFLSILELVFIVLQLCSFIHTGVSNLLSSKLMNEGIKMTRTCLVTSPILARWSKWLHLYPLPFLMEVKRNKKCWSETLCPTEPAQFNRWSTELPFVLLQVEIIKYNATIWMASASLCYNIYFKHFLYLKMNTTAYPVDVACLDLH